MACGAAETRTVTVDVPTVPEGLRATLNDCAAPNLTFDGTAAEASEFAALVLVGQGETIECEQLQNATGRAIVDDATERSGSR